MTAFIQLKTRPSCVDKIGQSSASHRPTCASSYQNDSELRRHGERSAANHARHAPTQCSSLRNKLVAEGFYLINAIEKYGSGFIRIRQALQDYPEIDFEIKEFAGGVMVTFAQKQPESQPESPPEGVSGGVSGGVNVGVNVGVNGLRAYIQANPGQRAGEMAVTFTVTQRTVERWLKQLKDSQHIEFRGAPKTGGYYPKDL